MISFKELLHGHSIADVPINHQQNLVDLQTRVNRLREAWGRPLIVTSGYRTAADQARINPKAPRSKHMEGNAVDIADPTGELYAWAVKNEARLTEWGLWCERRQGPWLHVQRVQYGSYKPNKSRFFNP